DRRLQKLEEQLQTLLKEVKDLRGGTPRSLLYAPATVTQPGQTADRPRVRVIETKPAEVKPKAASASSAEAPKFERVIRATKDVVHDGKTTTSVVTLVRSIYKLPHAKAEALASLLTQHSKADVLETKVEGDSLIITTTPEAHRAITQFIDLLQGTTSAGAGRL